MESIDDVLSEGGLLGGGGGLPGSGIFAEVVGAGAETAGDIGVEAGNTVADAVSDVLTGTAASALGNTISSAINGSTVAVEPNPLPVEGGGGSGGTNVTVSPDVGVSPTFEPTLSPDFGSDINFPDLPDLNLGVPDTLSVDRSPLPVQRDPLPVQRDPLPVEAVDPLPIEDVGPITVSVMSRTGQPPESDRNPGFFERAGDDLDDMTGGDGPFGPIGRAIDTVNPTTSGGYGNERAPSQATSRQEVTVTHSPTYNVDVDPRRLDSLADRIVSEIEDGIERDIDALEDDLQDLESELDELDREITNSR
ncbi:hypothetical protein PM038_00055 [Halorubrum ezzemoulense]|uniref:hypothetical protein n=1 Tax=Halorubrum ezzemoulense TaxID=337243 RepID=UPI00232F81A5|nr:hypothetical protein [Halorubrum ezzemoulense]MDB2283667.1 hypothetical protein [Halorubrum ezzemoulense]